MPQYLFCHPEDDSQIVEVFFLMNDKKFYIDDSGLEWRRVFTVPQASIDSDIDPNNREEFARRAAKYSTVGDLADKSKELSEKRKSKEGYDPLEQKFFKDYAASRGGKKHPKDKPTKIETKFATVDFTAKD